MNIKIEKSLKESAENFAIFADDKRNIKIIDQISNTIANAFENGNT